MGTFTCTPTTTITPSGVVIFFNGPDHRGDLAVFDRTVVHEMAHGAQLATPAARQGHLEYLRSFTARRPDTKLQARYELLMDTREQQAENLEALATQLPGGR